MKFRWHRGSLDDSMQTVVDFESFDGLVSILRATPYTPSFDTSDIKVEKYCYDPRIEWDTYIVTIDGNAIGFTDGPLLLYQEDA